MKTTININFYIFQTKFGKVYSTAEEEKARYVIFANNFKTIQYDISITFL